MPVLFFQPAIIAVHQVHRLFRRRVGQARFERRPTITAQLKIMVGRRGEAPLVPPYSFRRLN